MSSTSEFAFQFTVNAIARIIAANQDEARERLKAIECIDLENVDVPGLQGRLTEASIAHDPNEAELFEIDGNPPCRECGEPYEEGGDGWDGLCPECADRASIILDAEEEGWTFVETPAGWYAERDEKRTQTFAEQVEAATFVDEARDLLDLPDPGDPDVVYFGQRFAIFVHDCFWHGHDCAAGSEMPEVHSAYWMAKVARNRERDQRVKESLKEAGWRSFVVWRCELKSETELGRKLQTFLDE
jgi:DNA mismatch endonuclease Vsr